MKGKYNLGQQLVACTLLLSLCLQSCSGFINPSIPLKKESTGYTKAITPQVFIQPLLNQKLIAQGGHLVTFYEATGELKADVEMNLPQGFSKSYEGLSVSVEQGTELSSLPQLDKQAQQHRIHLQLSQGEQPAKLVIYKGSGLMGGGDNKDGNEDEAEVEEEEEEEKPINNFSADEIVVFCGNPGVGKSSLCNSIFQKPVFKSGARVGKGKTTHKQEFMHNERLYIDTPGLDDIQMRKQAAEEIEKALKHNDNYKIIFVATLESGSIRSTDLVTINTVCDAIKTDFEYGIIFNKVTNPIIRQLSKEGIDQYLTTLNKKPWSTLILKKDSDMEDEEDMYFSIDSENRKELTRFIYALKANRILDTDVNKIDVREFEEKINEIEQRYKKEIAELGKRNEEQAAKINTIDIQLQQSSEELRKQKEEAEKIKQQQQQYKEEAEKQKKEFEERERIRENQLQQSSEALKELTRKQEETAKRETIRENLDIIIEQNQKTDNYLNASLRDRKYDTLKGLRKEIEGKIEKFENILEKMGNPKVLQQSLYTTPRNLLQRLIGQELPELKRKKHLLNEEYRLWHKQISDYFKVNTINDIEAYIERTYTPDRDGNYLIHLWAKELTNLPKGILSIEKTQQIEDIFIKRALDINVKNKEGFTPLHIAFQTNDREESEFFNEVKCDLLLQNNADPNIRLPSGETLLMLVIRSSCKINRASKIYVLLKHGADPCMGMLNGGYSVVCKDIKNWTPLHAAVERGQIDTIKAIISRSPNTKHIFAKVSGERDYGKIRPSALTELMYYRWNPDVHNWKHLVHSRVLKDMNELVKWWDD